MAGTCPDDATAFRIGYLFSAKKAQSFLRQELIDACRRKNIVFVQIDPAKSLENSGQFDAILHKNVSSDWVRKLEAYSLQHPRCHIIDEPRHIIPLHNRISMLQCVDHRLLQRLHDVTPDVTLKVPCQISVNVGEDPQEAVASSGMRFPLVAKPLVADGSAVSHQMFLVLNHTGLAKLAPPVVIQEFVNHGGVIFKVYVVGDYTTCTPRKSLQDCCPEDLENPEGVIGFSQISNLQSDSQSVTPPELHLSSFRSVTLPSPRFFEELSRLLRCKLHLSLFNYDLIQDTKTKEYYIVDINYFPGFAKMPNYTDVLSSYFSGLAQQTATSS